MRYSQLLIPTVKETPAEAEIPSHQLMIRAGYIRKLASGTYTYLPIGWRSILKISNIIREEMNAAGAQEISMPILQPMELWEKTGRNVVFQDIMCKFQDRHGRMNVLAPTAEEVVTSVAAAEISSYKQLPINLYQINTKFRDEFRPRFGVLRSREFIMKDAYSFDADAAGLDKSYRKMYDAYCRIFQRCGLKYVTVEADSGGMGGTDTEEFMVPCAAGEDVLISSDKGNYAANVAKAETGPREHDLSGEPTGELDVVDTPDCTTIDEVSTFFKKQLKTKLKPENMLKTLVLRASGSEMGENDPVWIVAVVRGDHELNEMKLLARVREKFGTIESLIMAEPAEAAEAGFVIGYVGPHVLGETCKSVMFVDPDAARGGFWVSGANEADKHVRHFNWQRDVVEPLQGAAEFRLFVSDIRNAQAGDPSPKEDGGVLQESRGIEVGHVFKLGRKYAKVLGATFLDDSGKEQTCLMGCYGIGVNRILASAIELGHDENGCVLPVNIAPFQVIVVQVNNDSLAVRDAATGIYETLKGAGVDVLLDDRDARPGVKFKDADLLGIPLRVVVGERGLKDNQVEVKQRTAESPSLIPLESAAQAAITAIEQIKSLGQ